MSEEKIGLYIVDLIHEITQIGYAAHFHSDFEGMVRVEFTASEPWVEEIYEHAHLGYPGCERLVLEKAIISYLKQFRDKVNNADS